RRPGVPAHRGLGFGERALRRGGHPAHLLAQTIITDQHECGPGQRGFERIGGHVGQRRGNPEAPTPHECRMWITRRLWTTEPAWNYNRLEIEDGPSRGGRRLGPSGFSPGGSG